MYLQSIQGLEFELSVFILGFSTNLPAGTLRLTHFANYYYGGCAPRSIGFNTEVIGIMVPELRLVFGFFF